MTADPSETSGPAVTPGTSGSQATRTKIVVAARDAFRATGFDRASTRAIAAAAGVNVSLISRYFGSKAGLYEAAVLVPLEHFLDDYVQRWSDYQQGPHSARRVAAEYLGGLYDLFRGNREVVLALVAGAHQPALDPIHTATHAQLAAWVGRLLDGVQVVVDTEAERRGWSDFGGGRTSLRMALGLAFSMAVLQDWTWPEPDDRPTREQVIDSMVSYVLRSMSNPGGRYGLCDDEDLDAYGFRPGDGM
ncbi:MAG TPA: TetR/AcrR family transcriptional regulator [Pseudonocardia sp.]|nr:TetR/AcrR family transcriptional regulator [Pseudonocardia sp.]